MRFLVLLFGLALAGCNSANHTSLVTPSISEVQRAATTPATTRALGLRVESTFGGAYRHPQADALLQETLGDLVRASGIEGLPGQVIVLDSHSYNAAALPNGQLYVTRGMLALANDRAEIAAALAHELGHVISRHSAQRVVEDARARAAAASVARTFSDPEVTRAAIAAQRQSLAAFSREKELEADRIAIDLLKKAGYDPRGALRMLQSLDRIGGLDARLARIERAPSSPLESHPPTAARITATRALLQSVPASAGRTDRERYLEAVNGLAFGPSGGETFVRGRTYINRELDIAMTLPRGYIVRAVRGSARAIKQQGRTVLTFTRMTSGVAADPEGALRLLMSRVSAPVSYSALPNGLTGAMGAFESKTARTRLAIIVIGGKPYRLFATARHPDPSPDRDIAETLASLRPLNGQDMQLARPFNLRVARADNAAALARYAAQTGAGDEGVQLLLALNGLGSAAELRPGARLKVLELGEAPQQTQATALPELAGQAAQQ